jgi:hypothetical protein
MGESSETVWGTRDPDSSAKQDGRVFGGIKGAATRLGITLQEYLAHLESGEKWCSVCREWHLRERFAADASRNDGLTATCAKARNGLSRDRYVSTPRQSKRGEFFVDGRDGDKKQARARVNHRIKIGLLPAPNDAPCTDCGHVWSPGERRHEYDHHLGYDAAHHLDVQSVCSTCHATRDRVVTHCVHGHEYTPENTCLGKDGKRACRTCRRTHDRGRRDAAWWAAYRAKRKAKKAAESTSHQG